MCSTAVEFAGLTVVLVADLLQLLPVMGKSVWVSRMFQFSELTEVMKKRGDAKFIDLLYKIRAGNIDEDVQKQIRERLIEETDIN